MRAGHFDLCIDTSAVSVNWAFYSSRLVAEYICSWCTWTGICWIESIHLQDFFKVLLLINRNSVDLVSYFDVSQPKFYLYLLFLPCMMRMLCQSHLPWFDDQNNFQWKVQIMELLAKQFCPSSCHFFAVSCTNSPQQCSKALSVCVVLLAWDKVVAQVRSSCRFSGVCGHSCSNDGYISAVTDNMQ
jgi:hypothetical protein